MTTLNAEQQAAVDARDARILCWAGAGSGKTRTLVERVARLLREGVHPAEILCVTFTRRAAREMLERLKELLPNRRASFWRALQVTTFHAWAARLLREYADVVGLSHQFTIRDEKDREDLIKFVGRELGLKHASWARLLKEEAVRTRYYQLLREANAVDYDELEHRLLKLVRARGPELADRWHHVLVDEVQDTSELQQQIVATLAPRHLFLVGDLGQAIYSFRGGHPAGITEMASAPSWRVLVLATNYRSEPAIVEAASRVAAAMEPSGLQQVAGREPRPDVAVDVVRRQTTDDLHAWVANVVGATRSERWAAWKDCAVLAPRWAVLDDLAGHLRAAGVPHVVARKRMAVWDTDEARWLINCLRVALNPCDHVSLWSALNAFHARVPLHVWAEARAASAASGRPVFYTLFGSCRVLQAIEDARVDIESVQEGAPPKGALELVLKAMRDDFVELHLDHRLATLDELQRAAYAWGDGEAEAGRTFDHRNLVDWYVARAITDLDEAEAEDAVQLLTIHAAKGLEWPLVWVLGCEEGSLPRARDGEALEEERRKFYVALTRGRDAVRLCVSATNHVGQAVEPSRFVHEAIGVDTARRTA